MNVLVTGAQGFIGKNLIAALKNIKQGKDCTRNLKIDEIYEFDIKSTESEWDRYCQDADFVFHLAGVNRPQKDEEFMRGNYEFTSLLLEKLEKYHNPCPIMLSSSVQATLEGRYENSEYGRSKLAGEQLLFQYAKDKGIKIFVYRFPNVFGKWCRPNYNSVVATFCSNIANDLPIQIHDRNTQLEMLYIDDLVNELLLALEGKEHHCSFEGDKVKPDDNGIYCYVPNTHYVNLGEIAYLLYEFSEMPSALTVPQMKEGSFAKKLYSTYLSYLPEKKIKYPLKMNIDERGSFTELLKTKEHGQISINISKPGITKGQHWHHSKWELFMVVSGHGLIRLRNINSNEVLEFEVSGEKMEAVYMLPGYTHSIVNLSESEDLVTVMWANELFDPQCPDTYGEAV